MKKLRKSKLNYGKQTYQYEKDPPGSNIDSTNTIKTKVSKLIGIHRSLIDQNFSALRGICLLSAGFTLIERTHLANSTRHHSYPIHQRRKLRLFRFNEIEQWYPNAELLEIPNAGHWVHEENATDLMKEVVKFIGLQV